ncbi:MAG: tail fiber domain-containing protein [Patescibacteria group bacterium]
MNSFVRKHKVFLLSIGFLVVFATTITLAVPPSTKYNPGETLDPSCAPGSSNCSVLISSGGGSSQWDDVSGGINYEGGMVGIGTSTPQSALDVNGEVRAMNLNVVGVGTTVGAPANPQADIQYDPFAYSYANDGHETIYRAYSYKTIGGGRVYSGSYAEVSVTDDGNNDQSYAVSVSWDAASGADGYRILRNVYGNGFTGGYDTTSTSFVDGNGSMSFNSSSAAIAVAPSVGYSNSNTINGHTDINADLYVSGNITCGGSCNGQWDDVTGGINYSAGKVGIGTTAPYAALDIAGDGSIIAVGQFFGGVTVPDLGSGTRMMWIPNKAAFRAGNVSGTDWDDANVGTESVAFGQGKASGSQSFAFGSGAVASQQNAFAFGYSSIATASNAVAIGLDVTASGNTSTAFGIQTAASASVATAFGQSTAASGSTSTAFGNSTEASGTTSTAFGNGTVASGLEAVAFGNGTVASGFISTAFGQATMASGQNSTAFGLATTASQNASTAFGNTTTASGVSATAFGQGAVASGYVSAAFGSSTLASGNTSTAFGNGTIASGFASAAFGNVTTAAAYAVTAFGRFNVGGGSSTTWVGTDSLFEIGNGVDINTKRNALTVLKNGNVGITAAVPAYLLTVGDATVADGIIGHFETASGTCDIDPSVVGGVLCTSDMNAKKNISVLADNSPWSFNNNITPANTSVFAKVLALTPVQYSFKTESDSELKHTGFIAQEVEQLFPELVNTNSQGKKTVNYVGLLPYAIQAIQDMSLNVTDIGNLDRENSWRSSLAAWFGNANNGIVNFFSKQVTTPTLCVGTNDNKTCITKTQLDNLLQNQEGGSTTVVSPAPTAPAEEVVPQMEEVPSAAETPVVVPETPQPEAVAPIEAPAPAQETAE